MKLEITDEEYALILEAICVAAANNAAPKMQRFAELHSELAIGETNYEEICAYRFRTHDRRLKHAEI